MLQIYLILCNSKTGDTAYMTQNQLNKSVDAESEEGWALVGEDRFVDASSLKVHLLAYYLCLTACLMFAIYSH